MSETTNETAGAEATLPDPQEEQFRAGMRRHLQIQADNEVLTKQLADQIVVNRTQEAVLAAKDGIIEAMRAEITAMRVECERVVDLARHERDVAERQNGKYEAFFEAQAAMMREFSPKPVPVRHEGLSDEEIFMAGEKWTPEQQAAKLMLTEGEIMRGRLDGYGNAANGPHVSTMGGQGAAA